MRRRTFVQSLGLLFLPFVRVVPSRPAQAASDLAYRDSVGSDGAVLRAVLSDHNPQTGVDYAAD